MALQRLLDTVLNSNTDFQGDDFWKPIDPETDPDLDGSLDKHTGMNNEYVTIDSQILSLSDNIGRSSDPSTVPGLSGLRGFECKISNNMSIVLPRRHNTISMSMMLRMKIRSADDIVAILDTIQYAKVTLSMGGHIIYTIPNLTLNFLILEKLQEMGRSKDRGITTFNHREWSSGLTHEEMRAIITTNNDDNICIHNRYHVDSPDDVYLDIPLLFDFFSYGTDLCISALIWHEARITITVSEPIAEKLKTLVTEPKIWLTPESSAMYTSNALTDLTNDTMNMVTMCSSMNHQIDPMSDRIQVIGDTAVKFLFIMIRSSEPDIEVTELPEITSIQIQYRYNNFTELDTDMFYVADYDKSIRLYVVSPDPEQDMRRWVDILNECKPTDHRIGMHQQHDNTKGMNLIFKPINLESMIIQFSHNAPHIEVQVHTILQNVLNTKEGMGGLKFSH
jgi:hypothetical protein